MAETRNKRSNLFKGHDAEILLSKSPASSTGSCHGTITSADITAESMSEFEKDLANGDVCNSTAEFFINSIDKKNNKTNYLSPTAKKHGRWQTRAQEPTPLSTVAIASAFPDFSSIGEASTEDNLLGTTGESFSVEIARGHRHAPNTSTPRQFFSHQDQQSIAKNNRNSIFNINSTNEPPYKSVVIENSRPSLRASNKAKIGGAQNNLEQKKSLRYSLNRNLPPLEPSSNISNGVNACERRSNPNSQNRASDEMGNSITIGELPGNTNISNSTIADLQSSKQFIKTSLRQKSTRFVDTRQCFASDEKYTPKQDGQNNYPHEARHSVADNCMEHVSIKRTKNRAVQGNYSIEHTTMSGNPTQSSTSFMLPWNNLQSNTVNSNYIPIFTAQGKVHTTRPPHEFIDSIDMPLEEQHICQMIEDMKGKNSKAQEIIDSLQRKNNRSIDEDIHVSMRKRSDSGLGDSGSENLGLSSCLVETELTKSKKLTADLQHKLDDCMKEKNQLETKCQHLETKVNILDPTNSDNQTRMQEPQQVEILKPEARDVQDSRENQALKPDLESFNQDKINLDAKKHIKDHLTQSLYPNDSNLKDEIQKLSSLSEELERKNSDLTNHNNKLMARNWEINLDNQKLDEKVHDLLVEKRQLLMQITHLKEKHQEKDNMKDKSMKELAQLKLEREQEITDWTSRVHVQDQHIEKLGKEIRDLRTKLHRTERSLKLLKVTSKKIMESTHEIEVTKCLKNLKKSTVQIDGQSKKVLISQTSRPNESSVKETKSGISDQKVCNCNDDTMEFDLSSILSSDDENTTHITERYTVEANTVEVSNFSNFSDILGHGFAENIRNKAKSLEEVIKLKKSVDTQTNIEENTSRKKFEKNNQSTKSSQANESTVPAPAEISSGEKISLTENHKRSTSFTEKNTTIKSLATRRHSTSTHDVTSTHDFTNSYGLIDDIVATKLKNKVKKTVSNSHLCRTSHLPDDHQTENCTICVQNREYCKSGKKTVRIERPTPVSNRMPITPPYQDEPTIRPSVQPGQALATVMKSISDELKHSKKEYKSLSMEYLNSDPSLGKKSRQSLAYSLNILLKKIESQNKQIYALYDVLEGQKEAGQEMNDEYLDINLTEVESLIDDTWNGIE